MAVRFDTSGEHYYLSIDRPSSYTLCGWVKIDVDRNYWSAMFDWNDGSSSDFELVQTGGDGTTFGFDTDDGKYKSIVSASVGTWYFIAITRTGSSGTYYYKADGDTSLTSGALSTSISTGTSGMTLMLGNDSFGDEWLNGAITSIKLWNTVLTQSELDAESLSLSAVRSSNLVASWELDSPSTTDNSGNGNTLSGGSGATSEAGPAAFGTDYYIDSSGGSNSNDGLSSGSAWLDFTNVYTTTFVPNDRILLKGSQTHSGLLYLEGGTNGSGGTTANPITIDSYGTGRATISNSSNSAVYYYDIGGITTKNLILSGGSTAYDGLVIYTYSNNHADYIIDGVDSHGWKNGYSIGGDATGGGVLSAITISGGATYNNRDQGIITYGKTGGAAYSLNDVVISGHDSYDNEGDSSNTTTNSGSGIVIGSCDTATITLCSAHSNGSLCDAPEGPYGIWAYDSTAITISRCVSYSNRTGSTGTIDGGGFDLDINTTNSVIEYCLSYDNHGPGYLLYGSTGNSNHSGNKIRYCISWGDSQVNSGYGSIMVEGNVSSDLVWNCTVVPKTTGSINPPAVWIGGSGTKSGIKVANNVFHQRASQVCVKSSSNVSTSVALFQGNAYYRSSGNIIAWGASNYSTLAAWRAAVTGQEQVSGGNVGYEGDPGLTAAATSPTVTDPSAIGTSADSMLLSGSSPVITIGQDISTILGVSPGTQDYWGDILTDPWSVGADEAIPTTNPNAENANGSGTSHSPSAQVSANAGNATATGAAFDATVTTSPSAGLASGIGSTPEPSLSIATFAIPASATASAFDATATQVVFAPAEVAEAAGNAGQPGAAIAPAPDQGTANGSAYDATITADGNASAGNAAGTGAALDAAVSVSDTGPAENAAGTGSAFDASVAIEVGPGSADGSGTAYAATAASDVSIQAGHASGTGAAFGATASVAPNADNATGTGTGQGAGASVSAHAGLAAGTGSAGPATITADGNAQAGHAAGIGVADPALYDNFQVHADGSLGSALSGQTWVMTGNAIMEVQSGGVVLPSGTGQQAGYATVDTGSSASTIYATWHFDSGTPVPVVALISHGESPFVGDDLGMHLVIRPDLITWQVREGGGSFVDLWSYSFVPELPRNTLLGCLVTFYPGINMATVYMPDGNTEAVGPDERIDRLRGDGFVFEIIRADAADPQAKFYQVKVDGVTIAEVDPNSSTGTGTGAAGSPGLSIGTSAGHAAGAGTAHDPGISASSNVPAGHAVGAGSAFDATVVVDDSAPAEPALGTGAAFDTSAHVAAPAGDAAGTGSAYDATASTADGVFAPAGHAAATGTAGDPSVAVGVNAGQGGATGSAGDPAGTVGAPAGGASGTGLAAAPTPSAGAGAGVATGSGAAPDAAVSTSAGAPAEVAAGTGAAFDANVVTDAGAPAGNAAGTGTAGDPVAAIAPQAGHAAAVGSAFDASVTIGVFASAGSATGSGAALGPSVAVAGSAGSGTGSGTSGDPAPSVAATAGGASGSGDGFDATAATDTNIPAGAATGTGSAYDPKIVIRSNAQPATATGTVPGGSVTIGAPAGVGTGTGTAFDLVPAYARTIKTFGEEPPSGLSGRRPDQATSGREPVSALSEREFGGILSGREPSTATSGIEPGSAL